MKKCMEDVRDGSPKEGCRRMSGVKEEKCHDGGGRGSYRRVTVGMALARVWPTMRARLCERCLNALCSSLRGMGYAGASQWTRCTFQRVDWVMVETSSK